MAETKKIISVSALKLLEHSLNMIKYFWRILPQQYVKMLVAYILRIRCRNKEYAEKNCSSIMLDDFKGTVFQKKQMREKSKLAYKRKNNVRIFIFERRMKYCPKFWTKAKSLLVLYFHPRQDRNEQINHFTLLSL